MTQLTIFDAIIERDEAMKQIEENTRKEFTECARQAVLNVAKMRFTFTTDDVWQWLETHRSTEAHDNRALGPIMAKLAKDHLIEFTGNYEPSVRRHCSPIRVWRRI